MSYLLTLMLPSFTLYFSNPRKYSRENQATVSWKSVGIWCPVFQKSYQDYRSAADPYLLRPRFSSFRHGHSSPGVAIGKVLRTEMWPSGCRAHSLRTWSLCLSCTLQLPCCCCVLCNKPLHNKDGSETQYRGDTPCSRNHSHPQVELPCGPVWYSHEVPWPSWTLQPASALELGLNPDLLMMISDSALSLPLLVQPEF